MQQFDLGLNLSIKKTRKREFLEQMQQVVPWRDLVALIAPYAPEGRTGRPPFPVEMLLRIHFMQQWFTLSDPAMEEALHDMPLFRDFVGLSWDSATPDETTILRFRHLLETHKLAEQILKTITYLLESKKLLLRTGTIVDATLIAAPTSTKNSTKSRDPEMHQTKKGNQWYFGMKANIGVDADSGLVHTVRGTAANVSDVVEANSLLHGQEVDGYGDASYQGVDKRPDMPAPTLEHELRWHIAMKRSKRKALDLQQPIPALREQLEKVKSKIRAKVEHPFRVIKRQFGHVKVRCRGLRKNTQQLHTLFALANLWMARACLLKNSQSERVMTV
ncbi:IS5 family transposase [Comamonas sp. Y33R10-2]|uniref:IS5 family transposase n=1 Tax=Comamonas sp. Y33R10-2 TaxID=2853257 RepID=UPI001C5CBA23|nr:IS5 family transposase [Comamonas sp. Y33R10-2]QXZ10703.1 IS5 family transposase [Comamonas sp. Y33R10-2]